MRIGVTYDLRADYIAMGYGEEETAELDSIVTIDAICAALAGIGLEPVRIGGVKKLVARLRQGRAFRRGVQFQRGLQGQRARGQVPALLDAYEIPYVFSDALTLALSLDKGMCKRVVRDAGVPTVDFRIIEKLADVKKVDLPFPLFLKPVQEGSGKGIGADSKVENARDLRRVAQNLLAKFQQPVLVETFLPGREFTVGIVGTGDDAAVLGVSEIKPKDNWVGDGYGYENKEYSDDKVDIVEADKDNAKAAGAVALAAWRALRCRDGGRIDVRCDGEGRPHFHRGQSARGHAPDYSDLCLIAGRKGLSHAQLVGRIMASFFKRNPELKARQSVAA